MSEDRKKRYIPLLDPFNRSVFGIIGGLVGAPSLVQIRQEREDAVRRARAAGMEAFVGALAEGKEPLEALRTAIPQAADDP